ncbi:hypothetical protein B0H13DRAFT_2031396 [Mycena leptocephala]|nr:hypothetical protein B0H13DRAFT_2133998 [Mycena leptocephala]KAJ7898756.1 hypothetical protein B0H13DRAFT_2031396 [Mycena leptocephala]
MPMLACACGAYGQPLQPATSKHDKYREKAAAASERYRGRKYEKDRAEMCVVNTLQNDGHAKMRQRTCARRTSLLRSRCRGVSNFRLENPRPMHHLGGKTEHPAALTLTNTRVQSRPFSRGVLSRAPPSCRRALNAAMLPSPGARACAWSPCLGLTTRAGIFLEPVVAAGRRGVRMCMSWRRTGLDRASLRLATKKSCCLYWNTTKILYCKLI